MRKRINQLAWRFIQRFCATGEKVHVQHLKGDGWVAPGTCESTDFHVYRLFGVEFVGRKAADRAKENFQAGQLWFHRFGVWGYSDGTRSAINLKKERDAAEERWRLARMAESGSA